jgi:hypothetical protein
MEGVSTILENTMRYRVECHKADIDAPVNYFHDTLQNALDFMSINLTMSFVDGTDELPHFILYVDGIETSYAVNITASLLH